MTAFAQPGRGLYVIVCAKGNDQDICVIGSIVRGHAARVRFNRCNDFLAETHTGLVDRIVGDAHRIRRLAPKHHIQLRSAEDKGIVLIDQRQAQLVAQRFRQNGGKLEPAESRPQDSHS